MTTDREAMLELKQSPSHAPIVPLPELMGPDESITDSEYFVEYFDKIFKWGVDRGIIRANGATALAQITKLRSEIDELEEALKVGDWDAAADGIGDATVVLIQISRLTGIPYEDAIAAAWKDIKDRKGQMFHGIFVKQKDLDKPGMLEALNSCASAEEVQGALDVFNGSAMK